MGTWAKAKSIIRLEVRGEIITRYPGDWVELGGQELRRRLGANQIEIPDAARDMEARELERCSIVVVGPDGAKVQTLRASLPDMNFSFAPENVPLAEFMFMWMPETPINAAAILAGFARMMSDEDGLEWDMLACLADNEATLADAGTEEEQIKTEEKVGTLRLPVYEPGALWVRSGATNVQSALYALYADLEAGVHPGHAFVRALFPFPLAICTLGADWVSRHVAIRR